MHIYLPIFFSIVLMHLLYDFHWQGDYVGIMKAKSNFILAIHSLTLAMLLVGVLALFDCSHLTLALIFLFVTHYFIDAFKCHSPEHLKNTDTMLMLDQAAHLITMIMVIKFCAPDHGVNFIFALLN